MVVCNWEGDRRNRLGERLLIESGLEDRLDTLVGDGVNRLGAATRGLHPRWAVEAFQPQDPEARAIALFGMPAAGQERIHHRRRGGPNGLRPLNQP
ncbi:MAG: hypothetical protein NBKEAIPA_03681 [Nitrospirae bacterium]|nr:hypothetical protein [Nitrospirota bacterium]